MRLLLDGTDEGEHRGVGGDADLMPAGRDERAGAVAVVLDHAEHRHLQAKAVEHRQRDRCMLGAAVDEQ